MPVIPVTQKMKIGGSWSEVSPGKSAKLSEKKKKLKAKGLRGVA
jgi:hypothetical protein